ncbi:major facilitator superfamily domain-containing protein [Limtongia smithiae]|uniref:major facilitator superfamily domain-containing protein n=1 Tax=Limtongia smithiae TaxID=1125753 RepID=UPI0034CEFB87
MGLTSLTHRFAEKIDWYPKEMSKEERHLVFKIDWLVLSFSCIAFFTKNLDVSAITNAYIAGMDKDLDLNGDRLSYANAMYYVGYCLFQIPSNIVLTRLPAEYYLPAAEVMWGVFTLGHAFVKTYKQLMVMRFFVGFTATACWVGNAHIVNSWYTSQELGKRNAIYGCVYPLGAMFAGYLQSAAYNNLNGAHGLAGWRWLFVVCAIITIPCALIGVFFCPNVPDRTRSRFLTPREKELCVARLLRDGFAKTTGVDKGLAKRIFGNWRIYVFFVVGNLFWMTPYPSGIPYALWLDSKPQYGVSMVNNLSTITYAAQIVSIMVCGFYSDWRKNRWETMLYGGVLILVCNVLLLVWNVSDGAKFFAFVGLGVANGPTNLIVPWLAEEMSHDLEARSASIAILNVGWVVINLVVPLVAWPTSSAPRYFGGYLWSVITSVLEMILLPLPIYLLRREKKMGIDYKKAIRAMADDTVAGLEEKTEGVSSIIAESADADSTDEKREFDSKKNDINLTVTSV